MLSSRERRPATAGNNNRNSAHCQQNSARSRPQTSLRLTSSCQKTAQQLNDPLVVNRKYDKLPKNDRTDNLPPTLPANNERYPTIRPYTNLEPKPKRPLSCPIAYLNSNLNPSWEDNPSYKPRLDAKTKKLASQHFIEKNYEHMREYRNEFRDKTPRSLYKALVTDKAFCSTMRELKKKECSVKNGTSSYNIQSIMHHAGNTAYDRDPRMTYDPFMNTLNTSRDNREDKVNMLFVPSTRNMSHTKTFNRGYRHDSEFKNFSDLNGHLIRNKGTMLDR